MTILDMIIPALAGIGIGIGIGAAMALARLFGLPGWGDRR